VIYLKKTIASTAKVGPKTGDNLQIENAGVQVGALVGSFRGNQVIYCDFGEMKGFTL